MSDIKEEISKIDSDFLTSALEFAAHAMNHSKAVKIACEEQGVSKAEGMAYTQFFAELGMMGFASMKTKKEFEQTAENIKASLGTEG